MGQLRQIPSLFAETSVDIWREKLPKKPKIGGPNRPFLMVKDSAFRPISGLPRAPFGGPGSAVSNRGGPLIVFLSPLKIGVRRFLTFATHRKNGYPKGDNGCNFAIFGF